MTEPVSLKQFNCTVPADDVNAIKKYCFVNGITLSGMTRFLLSHVLSGEISLDLDMIRRADYEYRSKGSRF